MFNFVEFRGGQELIIILEIQKGLINPNVLT